MSVLDLLIGLKDLFDGKAIMDDLKHTSAGARDLFESIWNEERVLTRNAQPPLNRVPTADELSYRN